MPRFFTALLFLFSFLACSFNATAAPAPAAAASAASGATLPVVLTPDQARQALIVLNDPKRRAQVEDTLRAVAAAGALAAPAPAASTPAAAAAPASAASGVAAAFKSNGLVTQLSRQLARWAQSIARETRHSLYALLDLGSVRAWWTDRLSTPSGMALLLGIGWVMLATLVPAGIVEWLLTRLALKPRRKIAARANADAETQRAEAALTPAQREDARDEQIAAALKGDEKNVQPISQTHTAKGKLHALRHWALFRRMPAALLNAILAAVPVVGFALVASLIMSMLTADGSITEDIVSRLVDIYVICRGVLIVVNLFIAPRSPGLRLWRVSNASALFCQGWMRRIVAVVGVGSALAEVPMPLGLSEDAHIAIMKLTALVAHVMVAIVILECRHPVGNWLRQSTASHRSLSHLGNWLADIWAGVAVFFVLALWLIWALDVDNGFETLVHLGGLSLAVLVVARMVAIVALGALAHLFRVSQGDDEAEGTSAGTSSAAANTASASSSSDTAGEPPPPAEEPSIVQRRAYRYYPMVRQVVSAVVGLIAMLSLLDIWGVHLLRFLASSPTGHRLLSALVTIAVAGAVAVLIWEAVNISFERRLRAWTDRGEFVRASRLRTLMPMLRSALLVAIALIVGLTGLSQIGVNTAPLLAGASIFGVALGFGSQKLVQDFITGIFLLMENAMQVGDWVTVAGVSGSVEYLSIRTVRLRGGDGSLFTVPFSSVTTVNNVNRGIGNASVRISIAYGADVDRSIALLKSIGAELRTDADFKDGILSDFSFWGVDAVDGSAVTLAGQIQCRDSMRWPVQREFNRRILARFTAEGIDIANPLRNVMIPGQRPSDAARAEGSTDTSTTADTQPPAAPAASAGEARPAAPAAPAGAARPTTPAASAGEARPAAPSGAADAGKR
jgi:moderate conductance mechanosensitive channel